VDYDLCDVHGHKVMPDFVTIVPRSLVAGPPDSTPAFFWNLQNSSADQVMISGCARNGGTPASGWVILWYRHSAHFPSHWTVSDEIVEEAGGAPFDVDVYPNPEYFLNAQQAAVCNPPPDGTWTHDGWPIVMITPLNADGCCGLYIDDLKVAPVPPGLNYGVNVKSVNAAGQGAAFKVMFWNPHSMIS